MCRRSGLGNQHVLDQLCPTGALRADADDITLDRGRCILCGRCVAAVPAIFGWAPGSATARLRRAALVVPGREDDAALDAVRAELAARVRRLRRSVHIRHVDAGSDGSDEWEVQALLNPVYDVHRLGIFFTASPRHADILLVTGVGAAGMAAPLRRTREAMPDPVVVIAAGTDAISGGLFGDGYSSGGGVGDLVDVDVWVPGAPASPFSLLQGILLALDRLPAAHAGSTEGLPHDAAAVCSSGVDRARVRVPRSGDRGYQPTSRSAWRARSTVPVAWLLNAAGALAGAVAGGLAVAGHRQQLGLGQLGGLGPAALRIDRLSGMFVLISCVVAVPVLLASVTPEASGRPRLPATVALTLASVLVVETADHLFVLLFGWESLTVAFYLLTAYDRQRAGRARAAVAAVTFGKVSGAALLAGGLLLAAQAHTFTLADLGTAAHGTTREVAYGLLLFGFAVKVGIVPVQVWLPPSYAAAPGPARAIMAGVAVNVGFYGMWRTLQILGQSPVWLASVVLVVGGVTAILGIAHAAVHPDLAGLIAWSSVENAGVITAGFGAALVGSAAGNAQLVAAGMLAATAQVIAHALGKSLLFTAAAAVEDATGTTDLDALRGIARRMPFAGTGLVIGALTLAGLPLTAGFASEWFTLESLMQQFRVSRLPLQLASATAGALVALTVGVAGVTFVRLIALTAFGHPPTPTPERSRADRVVGHRLAVVMLGLACLGVAAVAPLEVRLIAHGLRPIVGSATNGALASPWVLQPVFADFSALSPTWLWIAVPTLTALAALTAVVFSGSRLWRVRRVPAWSSASPGVDRGVGYTSFGYANPMRKVLANLLLTRSQLHRGARGSDARATHADGAVHGAASGDLIGMEQADAHSLGRASARELTYRTDVVEVVERFLYRPAELALSAVVRTAKRLQSGRLDAYMTYMLIALVAVLAVVTAMA